MLILAQPRSASTSLVQSIAKVFSIKFGDYWDDKVAQLLERGNKKHPSYSNIPHSDNFLFAEEEIKKMLEDSTKVYKHHLIPTDEHIKILKDSKKKFIVLVRDPAEETYDSYIRRLKEGKTKDYYNIIDNKEKVISQMNLFNQKYHEHFEDCENCLFLEFHKLIEDQPRYMNLILEFFNRKHRVKKKYNMIIKNYSNLRRHGKV